MAGRRSMIFDILADSSKAKKEFDKFEEHALGVAASIATAYAGAKIVEGIGDTLASEKAAAKVAAQLDLIPAAAQRVETAANAAFRDGMGESLEDVSRGLAEIGEDMVDLNDISAEQAQKMVTDALTIADAYDKDVSEVTRAAGQLMKNGLAADADEAFDIITAGMQGGLDKTDEFLDTLWEYSEPMAQLGIDGPQALAMFGSALESGAFSVDKAGDALNEFATRSIDGSKASAEAYATLGLDAEDMAAKIAAGGPAANAAFTEVIGALSAMDDEVAQDAAGVALFGSMWEDAGKGMVLAMDPAQQQIEDVSDATEAMGDVLYDTGQDKAESMRRSFQGWWQDLAAIPGPLSSVAAGVQAFGGDLLAAGGAIGSMAVGLRGLNIAQKLSAMWTGIVTGATWLWNAAMNANPIGLIVLAIAALVGAFIWAWNNVDWFREGLISAWEWIQGVWEAAPEFFSNLWEGIVGFFSAAWDFLKGMFRWTPLGMVISNWDKIAGFFGSVKDRVVSAFTTAWDFIKKVWKWTPLGFIISNWDKIVDFVKGLPDRIGRAASGMWDGIKDSFKSALNWLIQKWNDFSFTVGGGEFLGQTLPSFTLSTPNIPLLAAGGIVTGPTLAGIGEGGESEVVAPLSKLDAYMRSAGYGGGSDDQTIVLRGVTLKVVDADGVLLGTMRTEAEQVIEVHDQDRALVLSSEGI